jgi:hypothetical protein
MAMVQRTEQEERESLGYRIIGAMRAERSEFERGYLSALVDLWKGRFTDTPALIEKACGWYKPQPKHEITSDEVVRQIKQLRNKVNDYTDPKGWWVNPVLDKLDEASDIIEFKSGDQSGEDWLKTHGLPVVKGDPINEMKVKKD